VCAVSSVQAYRAGTGAQADPADIEASELFELHRARVYRFCFGRLGDREEAADAVQDTYAKAWLALRNGCEIRQPLPWLLTIAANVCASRYRAKRARPFETPLTEAAEATVTSLPSAELTGLPAALRALPDGQRRAFVLRELRGCSYEEICDDLGVSRSSLAALLYRARKAVASSLTGTGRRALSVIPLPGALRAFLQGGASNGTAIYAAAGAAVAATAAGTALLVGSQLGVLSHGSSPQQVAAIRTQAAPHAFAGMVIGQSDLSAARRAVVARPAATGESPRRSGPSLGFPPSRVAGTPTDGSTEERSTEERSTEERSRADMGSADAPAPEISAANVGPAAAKEASTPATSADVMRATLSAGVAGAEDAAAGSPQGVPVPEPGASTLPQAPVKPPGAGGSKSNGKPADPGSRGNHGLGNLGKGNAGLSQGNHGVGNNGQAQGQEKPDTGNPGQGQGNPGQDQAQGNNRDPDNQGQGQSNTGQGNPGQDQGNPDPGNPGQSQASQGQGNPDPGNPDPGNQGQGQGNEGKPGQGNSGSQGSGLPPKP
jgi:RNA polymerase sigma-70 factor, ECF subfamily